MVTGRAGVCWSDRHRRQSSDASVTFNLAVAQAISCSITNTELGSVAVAKTTDPAGAAQAFSFVLSPDPNSVGAQAITHGQTATWNNLAAGTYTLAETSVAGWSQGALVCGGTADLDGDPTDASIQFNLAVGQTISCSITNTQTAAVSVTKTTDPAGSAQTFSFSLAPDPNSVGAQTIADGQTAVWNNLTAGTYTLSETSVAGWSQGALTCTGVADLDGDPTDASIEFALAAAQTVSCAITNSQLGSVSVTKTTTPASSPQSFVFTLNPDPNTTGSQSITDGQTAHV